MSDDKVYIKIPYILRNEAKEAGAIYDLEQKSFYINDRNNNEFEKVFLKIEYEQKEKAKQLGAQWCSYEKKWWTYQFNRTLIGL